MGFLTSIPFLSLGGGLFGITVSITLAALMMGLWALILMILHPLHAIMFILAALLEYGVIYFFGFHLWPCFFSFFGFYIFLFAFYTLLLRRWLPLPKTEIEHLIKLAQLKNDNLLSEEEYKAAKKRLLKL